MSEWRLVDAWADAARSLDLDIVGPKTIVLKDGTVIEADLFLRDYGNPRGLIIVTGSVLAAALRDAARRDWYQIIAVDSPAVGKILQASDIVPVLRQGGWAGSEKNRPEWM